MRNAGALAPADLLSKDVINVNGRKYMKLLKLLLDSIPDFVTDVFFLLRFLSVVRLYGDILLLLHRFTFFTLNLIDNYQFWVFFFRGQINRYVSYCFSHRQSSIILSVIMKNICCSQTALKYRFN